jgi:hypothetical protein
MLSKVKSGPGPLFFFLCSRMSARSLVKFQASSETGSKAMSRGTQTASQVQKDG